MLGFITRAHGATVSSAGLRRRRVAQCASALPSGAAASAAGVNSCRRWQSTQAPPVAGGTYASAAAHRPHSGPDGVAVEDGDVAGSGAALLFREAFPPAPSQRPLSSSSSAGPHSAAMFHPIRGSDRYAPPASAADIFAAAAARMAPRRAPNPQAWAGITASLEDVLRATTPDPHTGRTLSQLYRSRQPPPTTASSSSAGGSAKAAPSAKAVVPPLSPEERRARARYEESLQHWRERSEQLSEEVARYYGLRSEMRAAVARQGRLSAAAMRDVMSWLWGVMLPLTALLVFSVTRDARDYVKEVEALQLIDVERERRSIRRGERRDSVVAVETEKCLSKWRIVPEKDDDERRRK